MMGWEGTEITSQIRTLIEDHHIGAVLLTTKNLKGRLLLSSYFFFISLFDLLCSVLKYAWSLVFISVSMRLLSLARFPFPGLTLALRDGSRWSICFI